MSPSNSELTYGARLTEARSQLGISIATLRKRLETLGHKVSAARLEDLEYRPRPLRNPGRLKLEQISVALQDIAREQGKDPDAFAPEVLWPEHFQASQTALRPTAGVVPITGLSQVDGSNTGSQGDQAALINATILFIDLMNSVALSTSLSLWEYNDLINDYQAVLREVIERIAATYPVGEWYLGGDQLAVFFYDPADAGLHERAVGLRRDDPDSPEAAEIDARLLRNRNRALYGALRCAVNVKNAWIAHPRNVLRVETDQPVLDVGIGINAGNVVLQQRGDGQQRIEGFAINFAKRVEGFARHGRYCRIMLSKTAFETFRSIVVEEAMLKQRAFFESYTPQEGMLKGLSPGMDVFELKFFHRLAGFTIPAEQLPLYHQIFENDPTNIWAYANLMNYHLFQQKDMDSSQAVADRALYSNPHNEKIYYDLAYLNLLRGEHDLAREYCLQCARLNDQMDIAYHLLSELERLAGRWDAALRQLSHALALSPGCADYHHDFAVVLAQLGRTQEARDHGAKARELFPRLYEKYPGYAEALDKALGGA